jgi:hypothetical protein
MTNATEHTDDPLYDATKPIACTMNAVDMPDHLVLIERIRTNLDHVDRTEHGVSLRLPYTTANVDDLRRFATEEKQCCEFWGFALTEQPDLVLRWDGPPETTNFMDRLIDYLDGRAPMGSLLGPL